MRKLLLYLFFSIIINLGYSQSGTCLKFDGTDDFVAIEDMHYNTAHEITALTVSGWILAFPGEAGWSIADFDRSEYYNVEIGWHDQSTNVVNFATYSSSGGIHDMVGSTNVRDGKWHFITAVYDGTDKRIYVDGTLDATATNPHSGTGLGIGGSSTRYGFIGDGSEATSFNGSRNGFYFKGSIDEVSIWHQVLTVTEIGDLMNHEISSPSSETNLQAYYKFNDGSGQVLADASSNNYDGQLGSTTGVDTSDPTWLNVDAAVADKMGTFDGTSNYATINNTTDINTGSNYPNRTISVWFNATDISKSGKQVIFEEGGYINGFSIYVFNSRVYIAGWAESNSWSGTYFNSTSISSGTWHHAALVLSGSSTFTAYLDGVQIGTTTTSVSSLPSHSGDISIGRNGGTQFHDGDDNTVNSYFQGSIDELRIWNEARSLADIKDDIHRELLTPSTETNLVCNLRFNQSTGTTINDYSSQNNDGRLGSITWSDRTAPIPYFSIASGNWNTDASWASGQKAPTADWSRLNIKHDITLITNEDCEEITISSGASLTINATKTLTVNEKMTNKVGNTGLILKATSSGPASLIHNTNGIEAKVETYFDDLDAHYFISSPISDAISNMYFDQYMFTWNEPNYSWDNFSGTDIDLTVCKGFDVWNVDQQTATYSGTLNNGNQSIASLTRKSSPSSGEDPGFNLVGNPYPSVLDINELTYPTGISATSYVLRHSPKSYYSWSQGGTGDVQARYIQPGQGFFVEVTTTGATMSFTNSARTHTNLGSLDKKSGEIINEETIIITLSKNEYTDKAYIAFKENATEDFDNNYDASKLTGADENPYVFSYSNSNLKDKLAINSFPYPNENKVVPLGLILTNEGDYTLHFSNLNSFIGDPVFYLKDKVLNKVYNIQKDSIIAFNYRLGQTKNRFDIYFKKIEANEDFDKEFVVYVNNNRIYLSSIDEFEEETKVEIFNVLGEKVYNNHLGNVLNGIPVQWMSAYYFMQLQSAQGTFTEKFFLPQK